MSYQSTNVWARGWSYTWDTLFVITFFCGFMVLLSCLKWMTRAFKKDAETPFEKTKITKAFFILSVFLILIMLISEAIWRMDAFYGVSTFYVAYWWHYLIFTIFTYLVILAIWIIKGIYTKQFPLYKEELVNFKTKAVSFGTGTAKAVKNVPANFQKEIKNVKKAIDEKQFKKDKHPNEPDILISPVDGEIIELSKVNDQAFAQGLLGSGIAIIPEKKVVSFCAPVDGKIATIFPTNHAFGIETKKGTSVLVHIGIDTVSLEGKHFSSFVEQGDYVKAGQKIIEADLEKISSSGYDITTMIVCTPETKGELKLEKLTKTIAIEQKFGIVSNNKE